MQEQTTFGKYQLRERINVGGMAEVFLADVDDQASPVALKRVLPNVARNKEFISMFIDEARLSVQLNHGGIAQVLDAGQIDDSYFIALEHVDGKDLGAILKQARSKKQPLSLSMACYIATKICEALHYAHNKKDPAGKALDLVHRDVSPSNVLISYKGDVKVTDFGLAKANGKATQTQAGIIKGKHGYMSPEQAQGQALDRRSDIFSVGVCLYEMLTGQRLFKGESDFSTLQRVRAAEVPMLSTFDRRVSSDLERIVLKALARLPVDRYATAEELARDIQNFMADSGNLCGPRELATYMQSLFGVDKAPAKKLKAPMADGVTGLAAFDDLMPVSTVSALIDLPEQPAPILMTEQNPPVVEAAPAPRKNGIEKRAATLVGMPLPVRSGDTERQTPFNIHNLAALATEVPAQPATFGGAAARQASLPPAPAPRVSAPPAAPRISGSVPPPAPQRASSLPPPPPMQARSASLPPPPAPRASSLPPSAPRISKSAPPPAPMVTAAPSVQLDWPEEDLATSRLDEPEDFQADATEQIELPGHSLWEDEGGPRTEAYVPIQYPKAGLSSTQKMIGAGAAVLLLATGAFALFGGSDPSTLKLTVSPTDATVLLDGEQLATANPYMIEGLDASKPHTIEVRKSGYSVWSTEVTLEAGETTSLPPVTLDSLKTETGFAIDSMPSGAKVRIDGQDTGFTTPVRMAEMAPGTHRIELVADGHAAWATQVHVAKDQLVELAPAELSVASKQAVFADNSLVASNDIAAHHDADASPAPKARKLSARERRLAAKRAKAQARAARASSSRTSSRAAASTRATAVASAPAASKGGNGTLRINTQPWSNVFVDGRLIGNTPQMNITLSAGKHRITLVNQEQHIRKMIEVTIAAGQVTTKIVKLK